MASERLVLDCSYALELILPTSPEWQSEAVELFDAIASREVDARVPWIFFAELAAVVTKRIRGRVLDHQEGLDFLAMVDSLGMHVDLTLEQSLSLHVTADNYGCGTFDAIYLSVARQMAIPVATRDKGMTSAARAHGIDVFERLR